MKNSNYLYRSLTLILLSIVIVMPQVASAEKVRFALPGKSMGYLPLFTAIHRGFFKDENLEVEVIPMLPDIAHNALLSGEVDYHGLADSALRLAAKGAPLKTIFFGTTLPNYFFMTKPQIKSVAELKGKIIGISRFGGTTDLGARVTLSKNGLDPVKDVILVMIGLTSTRVNALIAGSIDATIANPPDNVLLRQKGFRELLFLGDAIEFPSNGYTTSERQLAEHRDQVKRVVRALYRGLAFARERPEDSIKIMEREWAVDASVARESYFSLAKSLSKDGTSGDAGLRVHIRLIQQSEKNIGDIPFTRIVDYRVLEEVRRELAR